VDTNVTGYRTKLVDTIKTSIAAFRLVDWHDGVFESKEVTKLVVNAPAAMVSTLDTKVGFNATGEINLDVMVAVYVITEDRRKTREADPQCWELATDVAVLVANSRIGFANAGVPYNMKIDRLAEPTLRYEGVALAAVTWVQPITVGRSKVPDRMQDPRWLSAEGAPPAPLPSRLIFPMPPLDE
jgi:hypothetical protein